MKAKLIDIIAKATELDKDMVAGLLEIPKNPEMGDYAFPCFQLAKTLHKAPPLIANDVAAQIGDVDILEKLEVKGAYINFFIKKEMFVKAMLETADVENFGSSNKGEGKTICIDYSSPNVAKNFHVGHLRTTIIGNSLYKIYSKLGYKVERINHLGDWGTQFGKLIVAYKTWGNKEDVERDGVAELMRLYVKFHEEADKDDSLNDDARHWFSEMEQGNEEALAIWQWFVDISLKEYKGTYELLGMDFDHFMGESFYRDKTGDVVDRLENAGLLKESEGAKIVDLEEYNMAPCLIMKKDGSTIYATRDLAAILYRKGRWNFEKCLYVTGQEQKLHFAQVFKVIELLGNEWAKDSLVHIPYGLVSLEGAKLSTRSGNIIYAEDILKEAIDKVKEIIVTKNPDLANKDDVARNVGVGAIIFNDLYNQRIKDVSFKWDKVLNFDGETGPYVQYTYCRCASILRNANYDSNANINCSQILDEPAIALLKDINRFPTVVEDAAERYEPSVVARFAMDVAQSFSRFYNADKVLVDDEDIRNARLKLVALTADTLKNSLALLGIDCPEQM
ncbi:MAG: arginine--tRNA ligase [Lachnospiraceae bacterium]|nr:arginine--tRNA ligase [Lachnospiraceae bacterium]